MSSTSARAASLEISIRTLRDFGWLIAGALAIGGFWLSSRASEDVRPPLLVLGIIILGIAWLCPRLLYWPYRGWMALGGVLGFINTRIILALIYFLIFTPIAFVRRWRGKDDLQLRRRPDAESYLRKVEGPLSDYRRQF